MDSCNKKTSIMEVTMEDKFALFLQTVDGRFTDFVMEINDYLTKKGCKCNVTSTKTGYLVSYILSSNKRTLASFVTRKTGMKLRIYPEHISEYQSYLDTLPMKIKQDIRKASVCKRLINPEDCNPKCVMGYTFTMDGEHHIKCRYMAFMPTLSDENNPYIKEFLENELSRVKS